MNNNGSRFNDFNERKVMLVIGSGEIQNFYFYFGYYLYYARLCYNS